MLQNPQTSHIPKATNPTVHHPTLVIPLTPCLTLSWSKITFTVQSVASATLPQLLFLITGNTVLLLLERGGSCCIEKHCCGVQYPAWTWVSPRALACIDQSGLVQLTWMGTLVFKNQSLIICQRHKNRPNQRASLKIQMIWFVTYINQAFKVHPLILHFSYRHLK